MEQNEIESCPQNEDKKNIEPRKDYWFSWIILAVAFLTQIICFGLSLCFGIYFVTLLDHFKCTKRQVTVIGSMAYSITCGSTLLSSILYRKLGCRIVVMTGGFIASIACFLSYFAKDLYHLYTTYGFMLGLGLGLAYTPTVGILPDYFEKYRYFATGFVTVGSATGTFIFQPIFHKLIRTYAWQGSMLINSGIELQIVVFGSLMKSRTVDKHLNFHSLIESRLFHELKFWLLFMSLLLWGGSVYIVFSLINSLVISNGVSIRQSTYLAATIGLCNIAGRITSSFVGQQKCTNRSLFFASVGALFSVGILCASQSNSLLTFALSFVIFGFGFGCSLAQLPGVIMDYFGVRRLVNGLGYMLFGLAMGSISIPPLAGWIADVSNEETAYGLAFLCGTGSAALAYVTTYLDYRDKKRDEGREGRQMDMIPKDETKDTLVKE